MSEYVFCVCDVWGAHGKGGEHFKGRCVLCVGDVWAEYSEK